MVETTVQDLLPKSTNAPKTLRTIINKRFVTLLVVFMFQQYMVKKGNLEAKAEYEEVHFGIDQPFIVMQSIIQNLVNKE